MSTQRHNKWLLARNDTYECVICDLSRHGSGDRIIMLVRKQPISQCCLRIHVTVTYSSLARSLEFGGLADRLQSRTVARSVPRAHTSLLEFQPGG